MLKAQKACPKGGTIWLTHKDGSKLAMKTTCSTWGCPVCTKRLLSYVQMKMEHGCSTRTPSYFITITNTLAANSSPKRAEYVQTVWHRFLRRLKRTYPNPMWFKIIELTKNGQPHLHVILNNIGTVVPRCQQPNWSSPTYRNKSCDCLTHLVSRCLEYATKGESYVCDAQIVRSPAGLAQYLTKYLVKQFDTHDQLVQLGFTRRYSASIGWGLPRRHLKGTLEDEWKRVDRDNHVLHYTQIYDIEHPSKELVMDETTLKINKRQTRQRLERKLRGMQSASTQT